MSRHDPSYRLHRQSGQAIVTLSDGMGGRRDVLLGPHDSPQSREKYYRVLAEYRANGCALAAASTPAENPLSVAELLLLFWRWAEKHYRHADATPTSELDDYRLSLRPLRELYALTPAAEFGPGCLKAVRDAMLRQPVTRKVKIRYPETGKVRREVKVLRVGLARKLINQRIGRIGRVFKWAVAEEFVPPTVLEGLRAVRGLQAGRTDAREGAPVLPVPEAFVEAVLPLASAQVAAMIRLQTLTGMRPGETCRMRTIDIDMTGAEWTYKPPRHKTAWRGKPRVIPLGPRAREILRPWLRLGVEEFLFQPREVMADFRARQRLARKSAVQPSQQRRRKRRPKKTPGNHYTPRSYGYAIERACKKAAVPPWNPNQLRHNYATEVRRRFGLEAAQVAMGHSKADVTQVYAERDQALAERVAREIG
jgi:integrase